MKILSFFIVFQVVLLNQIYTQSEGSAFTIYYNGEEESVNKFKRKVIPADIVIYDTHECVFLSIKIDSSLKKDVISIKFTETDYYPNKTSCKLNHQDISENPLSLNRTGFRKYFVEGSVGNDGKYVFQVTFKYGKKFQLYDLLLVPSLRHCFSNEDTVELVEL